ncbi:hypothetical protein WME99_41830 [Sorangium sp. So ce136]|uniref:hypothetical protein n=1 Tax=Sorangium sp. So ce136 TaxID=3133284 RepID=UPI003F03F107
MILRCLLVSLALVPVALAASTQRASARDRMPQNGLSTGAVPRNLGFLNRLQSRGVALVPALEATLEERGPGAGFTRGSPESEDDLLKYIVGCAIDSDVSVEVGGFTWSGELGLCGATSTLGDWMKDPAQPGCLEAVSACVLARVNALGRRVPVSLRGQDGIPMLLGAVPVQRALRDGSPIQSFRACSRGEITVEGNCGWTAAYVGICQRGARVRLERREPVIARVCKGIHGCDHDQPDISSPPGYPFHYAGFVGGFDEGDPIEFMCPWDVGAAPSGQLDHTYFSVMVAPADKGPVSPGAVAAPPGAAFTYPAAEREVFTYAEGAFYGDIFKAPPASHASAGDDDGRHACYSEIWSAGEAYFTDRFCAGPARDCELDAEPHPCRSLSASPPVCEGAGPLGDLELCAPVCAGTSPAPESAYLDCKEQPSSTYRWEHGITAFLNDPSDLASGPGGWATVCAHDRCAAGAALDKWCSPSVTRVCAVDPYCCAVAWDSLCVSEVESVADSWACRMREGDCSHPLCTTGSRCEPEPDTSSACIWELCAADPYCCATAWDSVCVGEVESVCGQTCD